jgi:hypothetical protein
MGIDTEANPMTERQPVELKAFFRDLVTACGGPKRAAQLVGAQASHISEAMAAHVPERWARLDQIAILEADCGQPIMTTALAERLGYSVAPAVASSEPKPVIEHLGAITQGFADLHAKVLEAMRDGHIGEGERRQILQSASGLAATVNNLRADAADPASSNVASMKISGRT